MIGSDVPVPTTLYVSVSDLGGGLPLATNDHSNVFVYRRDNLSEDVILEDVIRGNGVMNASFEAACYISSTALFSLFGKADDVLPSDIIMFAYEVTPNVIFGQYLLSNWDMFKRSKENIKQTGISISVSNIIHYLKFKYHGVNVKLMPFPEYFNRWSYKALSTFIYAKRPT